MRNLAEYPITTEEKIAALRYVADLYDDDMIRRFGGDFLIGDIIPATLDEIITEYEARLAASNPPAGHEPV